MKIVLIRHGKPEFEIKGTAQARDIKHIIRRYDESGIIGSPPVEAKNLASSCDAILCSDLRRSLHSAQVLGVTDIYMSDAIFREVAIPHFRKGAIILPVSTWGVILRIMSAFGFSHNGESLSIAKARAKQAAAQLMKIAHNHKNTMLIGHGFINYFIAKELLSQNWVGPSKPGSDYWGYGVYRYNGA
jgi:broad specificity phosphatase PhoE